eukprot:CAMPEP_0180086162 /NCGR_PEP_ID=MMETSP0985-20121206/20900_1 /TAXON_ID=483367 /ORGANISM="non described non described, Strain CCMP 2436" /LENGTH=114 /DNA_ID=CAMNT_0022020177 /DNA_START=3 /DNA_END=348 /DNA_ORIENTATION=+
MTATSTSANNGRALHACCAHVHVNSFRKQLNASTSTCANPSMSSCGNSAAPLFTYASDSFEKSRTHTRSASAIKIRTARVQKDPTEAGPCCCLIVATERPVLAVSLLKRTLNVA